VQAGVIVNYIKAMFAEIGMLRPMVERETADGFELKNGISIQVTTASFRGARGFSSPLVIADEIAFWYSDERSANPDREIIRALRPSLGTIPNSMLIAASSPYARRGALWEAYQKHYGKDGDPILVWQASTQTMNPSFPQAELDEAFASDPESARAEYGAEFRSDISSYISREVIEACVDRGTLQIPYNRAIVYSAFVDPSGGSNDSMTLAIAHKEFETHVLDHVEEIKAPFDPEAAVQRLVNILQSYKVRKVVGDRYGAQWVSTAFERHGIRYEHSELNRSELYIELLPALNSKKVRLLDNARLISQLANLERRTGRTGKDSVDHPPGGHDDVANAVAGVIAIGAQPTNKVSVIAQEDFMARLNSDNYAMQADGTLKFQKPMKVYAHPVRGLPSFMREEAGIEITHPCWDEPGRLW